MLGPTVEFARVVSRYSLDASRLHNVGSKIGRGTIANVLMSEGTAWAPDSALKLGVGLALSSWGGAFSSNRTTRK